MSASFEGNINNGFAHTEPKQTKQKNIEMTTIDLTDIQKATSDPVKVDALTVRGAYKKYKSKSGTSSVLDNYNMTVKQGTIYSLLGASGCGKTTVLSCCVGIRNLDQGEILVFGHEPGTWESGVPGKRVGYMPQELSLCGDFTIKEALVYYGSVYGIRYKDIIESMEFLVQFLELPHHNRRINTLSGGQQRRVSFAVSLIHDPELLILDEPTVGVDPLLRESIWDYLVKLVSTGKTTVIITTHYIEEARQSHTVGFMRSGRLLTEKSPQGLLREYKANLLEEIVLSLSRRDSSGTLPMDETNENGTVHNLALGNDADGLNGRKSSENSIVTNGRRMSLQNFGKPEDTRIVGLKYSRARASGRVKPVGFPVERPPPPSYLNKAKARKRTFAGDISGSMGRVKAVLVKNCLTLMRNVPFLLIMVLIPAVEVAVISFALGNEPANLRIGVVNYEVPSDNLENGVCRGEKGCGVSYLSCRYLTLLGNDTMILYPYENETEASAAVKKGETWGYLVFPEGFTSNFVERAISEDDASNETLIGSRITFELDMTNRIIGATLKKTFYDTFDEFIDELLIECGYDAKAARRPMLFLPPIYGTEGTNFKEFIVPSLLLGLLFFFPLICSGLSYITEKKNGILERSLVAGVTSYEAMLAYLLPQLVILLGQSAIGILIMTYAFSIQIHGSIFLAISLGVIIGIAGMSMGFVVSVLCSDEIQAVFFALGAFMPNVMLAGMMWPLEGMPVVIQYMAYLLPCTLACESLRSIVARGWGLDQVGVWLGFVSTFAWIAIYWSITIMYHRLSRGKK